MDKFFLVFLLWFGSEWHEYKFETTKEKCHAFLLATHAARPAKETMIWWCERSRDHLLDRPRDERKD